MSLVRIVARILALVLIAAAFGARAQTAGDVVISQIYGGGGNSGALYTNDFVELHNRTAAPVSLSGWSLQYTSATGTSWGSQKTALTGSISAGGYLLVQMASGGAAGTVLPAPDATGTTNLSATAGKIALVRSTTSLASVACPSDPAIADLVGYGATANCSEGAPAPAPSNTTAIQRTDAGCTDSANNATDFIAGAPLARNSSSAPWVCSGNQSILPSCPAFNTVNGIAGSSLIAASDVDGIVNSAAITAGGAAGIALGAFEAAPAAGGTARVRVEVAASVPVGTYATTVTFSNGDPQNASCTFNVSVIAPPAAVTPTYVIQGAGSASPNVGQNVTARGVVTGVFPGLLGFYIQDETGDGNALTSDALFVFMNSATLPVAVGERIQASGFVTEYANVAGNPTVTELSGVTTLAKLGLGSIAPTPIALPEVTEGDLERYEGMLVQISNPLTVSQNFFQGRYGQVTLSAGGRMVKPSNQFRPGTPEALAAADANARRRIVLDDGQSAEVLVNSVENPNPIPYIGLDNTLRAGDSVANLTGIVDFGRITSATGADAIVDYKLHPTVAPLFTRVNARQAAPPGVAGTHKVASFNVLNYFTTFSNGQTASGASGQGCLPSNTTSDCRGADNITEFNRQRDKIVRAIAAMDADVVGLMEIQRNGGVATTHLVSALNTFLGAPVYDVVPNPANVGTDAIQVAMIYKPSRLTLVGAAQSDSNPIHNRPPIAQTFQASTGVKFSVIVNHFKSKSCTSAAGLDLDQGDGQGCYNDRRKQQASALLGFISTLQASAGDTDVLVIGDLNAYGKEDPVDLLVNGGLADQAARFNGTTDYSYVFDGEVGYLDHALASASLAAQVTNVAHWHINADEPSVIDYNTDFKPQDLYSVSPYRASDHDPVLIGLALTGSTAQTISFPPLAAKRLDESPVAVGATASSGLPVVFSSLTAGACTVSGSTVTLIAVGTCTIAADQFGDATYQAAARVTQSFGISAALIAQSISFPPIVQQTLGNAPFTVSAAATSGLPVTIGSQTPAVCSVSGAQVTLLTLGTCTLLAMQAGDAVYAPAANVLQSFQIVEPASSGGQMVPVPPWALVGFAVLAGLIGRRGVRARHAT